MEWTIEIDPHRLTPNVGLLFPDDPLVGRADTVVAYEDFNRPESLLSLRDRVRTAPWSSEIGDRILEPDSRQILLASGDAHHSGATGRQELCSGTPYPTAPARDESDAPFDSRHASHPPLEMILPALTDSYVTAEASGWAPSRSALTRASTDAGSVTRCSAACPVLA